MPNFVVKKLVVKNFRGIADLTWRPSTGINIIIGGGDCGKTTILEAVGLLLHPSNSFNVSETDFFEKKTTIGFQIEAVIQVAEEVGFASGGTSFWPWLWDDNDAVLPDPNSEMSANAQEAVFKIQVAADNDFDATWSVVQPDGVLAHFPAALRRRLGLVKLSGDDRNDRDLRLVYGSALDRLISDKTLRAKIADSVSKIPLTDELDEEGKKALQTLDKSLKTESLPHGLELGLIGNQGVSIGALVGLHASDNGNLLPLTSWGAGTRRMTSLEIASQKTALSQALIIDEIERGLEPYRLKQLLKRIANSNTQAFVTTHSSIALSSTSDANLWFLNAAGCLGELRKDKIAAQQKRDPETFLWKIPVIVEGETEVGFLSALLESVFSENPLDSGVRVSLGQGDDQLLGLLETLENAGVRCCGFADDDGKSVMRWTTLAEKMKERLFRWPSGCIETNLISMLPDEYLEKLFLDEDGDLNGYRLRSVADRLSLASKSLEDIKEAIEGSEHDLRSLIVAAATGKTDGIEDRSTKKSWRKHSSSWFKRADGSGGRELLGHVRSAKQWEHLEPTLRPFINSILTFAGKEPLTEIQL